MLLKRVEYKSSLNFVDTELAIKNVKDHFEKLLADKLNLIRVSAPLTLKCKLGVNDDLSGVEKPIKFILKNQNEEIAIVQSLAKWKRMALAKYNISGFKGLYTDMNAIRKDEVLDNIHSIYVDQWDWERIINVEERNTEFLKKIVNDIYQVMYSTQEYICGIYSSLTKLLPEQIFFITSEELLKLYPSLTAKQRENEITKKHKAVFILQIGDKLSDSTIHDNRAPDYDDWKLNGDILVWYPLLEMAIELSSMGIRVNSKSLYEQLVKSNHLDRLSFPYHQALIKDQLPLTIGGGIGQSRLCLILLNKYHIGEVQSSIWEDRDLEELEKLNIMIL